MKQPLVSVIVPTKNSMVFLEACLQSIQAQDYPNIELIVVDNNSTDDTKQIAKRFTDKVYNKGPERSAQVNFGVSKAQGEFVYKVDSDFVLEPTVVSSCVKLAKKGYDAVVVHNSPDQTISWIAKVRKFEVDMYKYDLTHSSARFVKKEVYVAVGGFDSAITAGEDYDFQNKLNKSKVKTGFIEPEALHLGEPTRLWPHLKKYYSYGRDFIHYHKANQKESSAQLGFFRNVYIKHWRNFLKKPITGMIFVLYNLLKYSAGGLGFLSGRISESAGNRT